MKTAQKLFDTGFLGVMRQGDLAFRRTEPHRAGVMCEYRADDGRKCVAGHVISDELAEYAGNIAIANKLECDSSEARELRPFEDLLTEMQDAHDTASDEKTADDRLKAFAENMAVVAKNYGLTVPSLPSGSVISV